MENVQTYFLIATEKKRYYRFLNVRSTHSNKPTEKNYSKQQTER